MIKTRFRTLALTMVFAVLMPVSLFAQSDGFFRGGENESYQNRDGISSGMTNQQFQDGPVGSGLLILTVAGAGYAVARRKRNNKKGTVLFLAFAMLLGLTQCKKNVDTISTNSDGMTNITLRVSNDSKHGVNPSNGQVLFEEDDIIYVAKSGEEAYLGYLTCGADGETFSGPISTDNINTGDDLYFYFVGNLAPEGNLVPDMSEEFNVYINNQASNLPVISQGHVEYNSGTTSYSCELKNKCSLVKFKLPDATTQPAYLCDMKQKVRVNMNGKTITYTNDAPGEITLFHNYMDNTEKCAILLPTAAESEVTLRVGDQYYTATLPALTENYYYTVDAEVVVPPVTTPYFSVSSTKKVLFAPGNLQYNEDGAQWQFASHQYDYYTVWNGYNGWIDLFGWGTWGSSNNVCSSSTDDASYTWVGDFSGTLDGHNDWFTLESSEWSYLLGNSAERVNKYGDAKVNGVVGIVILPDEWATPAGLSFTPGLNDNYSFNNTYTSAQWSTMQEAGAVFLPAPGYRDGTTIKNNTSGSEIGAYWAKDYNSTNAYCLWLQMFDGDDHVVNTSKLMAKHLGYYVRLVRPYTAK